MHALMCTHAVLSVQTSLWEESQILALVIGHGGKNSNTINHLDSPGFGFWSHFFAQTGLYFYY